MNNVDNIKKIFSLKLRKVLDKAFLKIDQIQEIRLRVGQPLIIIINNGEKFISEDGNVVDDIKMAYLITISEIRETMEYISNYSLYAFEEEIKQGYITVTGGHRIGICGKVIMQNGCIKTIKYISFINIRVAHQIINCSNVIMDQIYKDNNTIYDTLIISPPGAGKTTLLRDMVRNISNGKKNKYIGLNVGIADERSEIAACYLGVPQNDVGIRTDVIDGVPKSLGIMMLIRTMSPKVIALDEIGSIEDISAIRQGINCGCRFICTVHGDSIDDIRDKEVLNIMLKEKIFKKCIVINKNQNRDRYNIFSID